MWFKNILTFELITPITDSVDALNEKLNKKKSRDCGKSEQFTRGWVNPLDPESDFLIHPCGNHYFIALNRQERLLPMSVVKDELDKRLGATEAQEARKVYAKEKQQMREDITLELLPRAFTKNHQIHAWIDTKNNKLIINTTSRNKAEELTSVLRECLGTLQLAPVETNTSPSALMQEWLLSHKAPSGITIEDYCVMRDPSHEDGMIKCQRQDLESDEVLAHLHQGKILEEIGLTWNDKLTFVLSTDLSIKRIKALELLTDQSDEIEAETKLEKAMADYLLMTAEYTALMADLWHLFGGLAKPRPVQIPQKESEIA